MIKNSISINYELIKLFLILNVFLQIIYSVTSLKKYSNKM